MPTQEEQAFLLALQKRTGTKKESPSMKLLETFSTAVNIFLNFKFLKYFFLIFQIMPFFLVANYEDKDLLVKWQNGNYYLF